MRSLERPTPLRQGVLLAVCVLAYLTRAQALAFFAAAAVAPFLVGNWRSFRVLYGAFAAGVVAMLGVQLVRGESPLGVSAPTRSPASTATSRARSRAGSSTTWPSSTYLGIFPFAASLVLLALWGRSAAESAAPFLAATTTLSVFLLLEVSAFARCRRSADRGAQPSLPRAARADRVARLGRPGRRGRRSRAWARRCSPRRFRV